MSNRVPVTIKEDPSILGEKLNFPTSKRVAENRFLKAAMTEKLLIYDKENLKISGVPNQNLNNLYSKWAHGGFGVILTGNIIVDSHHLEAPGNAIIEKSIDSEERKMWFKKLAQTMKSQGSLAIAQLSHSGRQTYKGVNAHPFSASDVGLSTVKFNMNNKLTAYMTYGTQFRLLKKMLFNWCMISGMGFGQPVALTLEQIQSQVIEKFVYAAKYCYEAGFDGIQLHAAHGYLLAQFLSPTTNKRDDKYGGSVENRSRLVLEIYDAIRAEIPAKTGFIIGIKMNSVEFQDQGLKTNDAVLMAKEFEKKGYDFIELSGGTYEKFGFHHQKESTKNREAYFLEFAKQIKPALTKAVVYLTGGFRTIYGMKRAIEDQITDGIGLGRPVAAEPDLPKKILYNSVYGALVSPYEKGNAGEIAVGNIAANSQMWQASETSIQQAEKDPCYKIMDLSDEKVAEKYLSALQDFIPDMIESMALGTAGTVLKYRA